MVEQQILKAALEGRCVGVGEFRDWEVKEFPKKDKNVNVIPGQFNVRESYFVTIGRNTVEVGKFADRSFARASDVKRPALKVGDKVVICIEPEQSKYGLRANGSVEPVTK